MSAIPSGVHQDNINRNSTSQAATIVISSPGKQIPSNVKVASDDCSPKRQSNSTSHQGSEAVHQGLTESNLASVAVGGPSADLPRNVSWQDMHGKQLFTVREFEPSESGVQEEEDSGLSDKFFCCSIM